MSDNLNREMWLDNVRTLACLMVVVVHVTALYKYMFGSVSVYYWSVAVALDSVSRMCVPLFFMVSGYIFLSGKNVKLRNSWKIFTALTFYSVISVFYNVIFTGGDIAELMLGLYSSPKMYHLWFLFYLFTFYVIFSLVKIKEFDTGFALIIIILLFTVFNYKLNDIAMFLGFQIKNGFFIRSDYFHLFLYTIAGAYLARLEKNRKYLAIAFIVLFISLVAVTVLTIAKSFQSGKFDAVFQTYTSVPVFFSAISTFYLVKCITFKGAVATFSKLISRNSLAIYGVHVVILEIIRREKYFLSDNPTLNMLFTYIIVFSVSLALAVIIKKCDRKGYVS
ncbi:acyltransferase family protein [Enterobacter sichuanensis]|uniref:acyltransferase n=1 Tax=Enterobacter sichuanensis TaxID=2071710 RepID=UPI003753B67D